MALYTRKLNAFQHNFTKYLLAIYFDVSMYLIRVSKWYYVKILIMQIARHDLMRTIVLVTFSVIVYPGSDLFELCGNYWRNVFVFWFKLTLL